MHHLRYTARRVTREQHDYVYGGSRRETGVGGRDVENERVIHRLPTSGIKEECLSLRD